MIFPFILDASGAASDSTTLPKGKIVGIFLSVAGVGAIVQVTTLPTGGENFLAAATAGSTFIGGLDIAVLDGAPIFLFNDSGTGDPAFATIYVQTT